jgi:membrane-associated phospholipid phosphatase
MAPPTETLINNLSPNNLWRIDRPAIRFYQTKAATISDWIATGSLCLPAMLLMDQQIRKKPLTPLSISLQATLATATTTLIAKSLTRRFRPYAYNPKVPMSVKTTQDTRESFFSGHTAMTACMTVSAATIWSDHHPNHTAKPWVWAGALAVPAAVACLRIKAGKHFFTDVLAGYAVGVAFGLLAPRLYRH